MNTIITGASAGIGEALARTLAAQGHQLLLVARRAHRLESLVQEIKLAGGSAFALAADLEVESECIRVSDSALELMGSVDAVAHNAGRGNLNSIEQTPTTVWRHMFALNVDAPFFLTRALLPHFRQRGSGHMVYVSSMAGRIGYPYNAAYVAAKHALVGFVAALRAELEGTEINATVVCPSGVSSEWGDVTEDGSINDLYTRAIPRSRVLAREQGLPYAPLKKLITSATAAEIIASVITGARSNDVYTHEGTMELALEAVTDRKALEDQHKALWLAMREVYQQMQDAK